MMMMMMMMHGGEVITSAWVFYWLFSLRRGVPSLCSFSNVFYLMQHATTGPSASVLPAAAGCVRGVDGTAQETSRLSAHVSGGLGGAGLLAAPCTACQTHAIYMHSLRSNLYLPRKAKWILCDVSQHLAYIKLPPPLTAARSLRLTAWMSDGVSCPLPCTCVLLPLHTATRWMQCTTWMSCRWC
jgi:hypothetical protein